MAENTFARWVFFWAGVYGIVTLLPMYFLEERLGRDFPPPFNHPEHFYGFIGVALAWQFAFIMISRDVSRFRPLMLAGVAEKLLFVASTFVLYTGGRVSAPVAAPAVVDMVLATLFVISYLRCEDLQMTGNAST